MSIRIDLQGAEQCKAIDMIRFLFAFCLSDDSKKVPVCDEFLLERAFEEVKGVANNPTLKKQLSKL